jgi:5-hydroxyisourate hydrolase-like protein (transthyretin family)
MSLELHVDDTSRSYHVPLLLAPYALTTYRGS